jgi:2-polyprenyl-3-methyl-5-hydroxy-6-metoxy-1,4-benzoquinol methylase
LIQRRHESFRSEWHALPGALRDDHWYYLSSRLYLFANAIHLHEDATTLAAIETIAAPGARVLDFGGGTGNLALALAAADRQVAYVELSALQKDFLRFRLAKHGLTEAVEVVDWWANPPAARYDVVIALDVLEHLPDVAETLTTRLLPALRRGGALLEASPFVRNISNPMHHEDGAVLEETLAAYGAVQERETAGLRIWRLPGGDHGEDVTAEPSRVDGAQRREKPL